MVPIRPSGILEIEFCLPSCVDRLSAIISVSIGPGWTEFALILSGACCIAVNLVNNLTPPLDAPYAPPPWLPNYPAVAQI